RCRAVLIQIVRTHVAVVGIRDVENTTAGCQGNAVGPALGFRNKLDLSAARNVKDAVEIQVARVLLISKRWIGEIDLAVLANYDIVGGIQPLALPAFGQYVDFALFVGSGNAARMSFTSVEPTLCVESV